MVSLSFVFKASYMQFKVFRGFSFSLITPFMNYILLKEPTLEDSYKTKIYHKKHLLKFVFEANLDCSALPKYLKSSHIGIVLLAFSWYGQVCPHFYAWNWSKWEIVFPDHNNRRTLETLNFYEKVPQEQVIKEKLF